MRHIWVLFCIFVSIAYAIPSEVEIASILSQPALGSAYSTTIFTITVSDIIFEGYPELIGRSYTVTVEKEADAFLVHTDGYVLSEQSIADQSLVQEIIYENIQEQLLKDMGRIEHVREFGSVPEAAELDSYYSYSLAKYGGKESLASWLLSKYLEGKLSVSVLSQQFQVTNGDLTKDAALIEAEDGVALLKIEGTDFPSVELSSPDSSTSGDTVYIVSQEEGSLTVQPSISEISGANNEEIETTAQTENSFFIIDSEGQVLGFGFSDSNDKPIISSPKLNYLFEKNGIKEKNSVVNGIYKEGVNAYFDGDYNTAKEKFLETLVHYPSHTGALKNLKLTEDTLSNKDFISNLISSLLKFISSLSQLQIGLIVFTIFILVIILIKRR